MTLKQNEIQTKKKYNIGIFWANPYCGNLGVQALAYSTIYIFEKIAEKKKIKFNYSFFGSTGQLNDEIKIDGKIIKCKNFEGLNYSKYKSWAKLLLQQKTGLKELLSLDLIVDVGGGDSYSDIYGEERFHTINSTKILAKYFRKKIIMFPQTIGPFSNKKIEKLSFKILKNVDLIFARDDQSFFYVEKQIINKKLINSIDCAFFLPYNFNNFQNNTINVGLNVSALLWHGGYTQNNQFGLTIEYKELTIKMIEFFQTKPNVTLHLIAHVIPPKIIDYDSVENDYKICSLLNERYPETILAPKFKNPIEAKTYISGFSFFTGARMHACIAAYSSGVPVLPLAYSRKFIGLFKETLDYENVVDMTNESMEACLKNAKKAFEERDILKEKISNTAQVVTKKSNDLLSKIEQLIS